MPLMLAFLAGLLTSLSPCVLPVLPLVVGGAMSSHRLGPLALCGGLGLSFSLLGLIVSLATQAVGFDPSLIRVISAALLLLFGLFLLIPKAQEWLSKYLSPLGSYASSVAGSEHGLWGNFLTGTLLGAVWSPCSGPTLGVAIGLAAQAGTAWRGFVLMLVFGIAASLPLVLVAYGARNIFIRNRARLVTLSNKAKPLFGLLLVCISTVVLLGWDKRIEAATVTHLPQAWVDLTTKF